MDDLGLTHEQMAERLGCATSQVSMLLSGERKYHSGWVKRISEALAIPEWVLFADPKTILDEFDSELASRFRDAPEDVQTTIKRLLGMMDMPYTQSEADASASIHDGGKPAKGDFKMPKLPKGKK